MGYTPSDGARWLRSSPSRESDPAAVARHEHEHGGQDPRRATGPSGFQQQHQLDEARDGHFQSSFGASSGRGQQQSAGAGGKAAQSEQLAGRGLGSLYDVPPGYRTTVSEGRSQGSPRLDTTPTHSPTEAANSGQFADGFAQQGRLTRLQRRSMLQGEDAASPPLAQTEEKPILTERTGATIFAVPGLPTSAPASVMRFDQNMPEHTLQPYPSQPSTSSGSRFQNGSSSSRGGDERGQPSLSGKAAHSRSSSLSSLGPGGGTYSVYRPHSLSISSSAGSCIAESIGSSSTGTTQRRVNRLSNLDRKELCEYAAKHPRTKHDALGQLFRVERSTVSKILKNRAKWLTVKDDNTLAASPESARKLPKPPNKVRVCRHPELEGALIEWGKQQTQDSQLLTDEIVKERALAIAATMSIPPTSFKASAGWLENFKDRAGYRNGKFSLEPVIPAPEESGTGPEPAVQSDQLRDTAADDDEDSASPTWTPSEHSYPSTNSGWVSPINARGPEPLSLSSSVSSLPGLAEERGEDDEEAITADQGNHTTRFSRPALGEMPRFDSYSSDYSSQLSPAVSYSSDNPPYVPLPTTSTGQHSTPTQHLVQHQSYFHTTSHPPHPPHTPLGDPYQGHSYPHNARLQQASINFNLNLNTSPMQSIEARQFLEMTSPTEVVSPGGLVPSSNTSFSPHTGFQDHSNDRSSYALRSRIASAPGDGHTPVASSSRPGRPRQATYSHPSPPLQQQQSYIISMPSTLSSPQKAPLHRAHTAPMPLHDLQQNAEQYALSNFGNSPNLYSHGSPGGLSSSFFPGNPGATAMQIDQPMMSSGSPSLQHTPLHQHQQHLQRHLPVPGSDGHLAYEFASQYPSSGALLPTTTSRGGTLGTSPSKPWSDKVSFDEALLSLRKVIGFIKDPNARVQAQLASPNQVANLEALLGQFQKLSMTRAPHLTPPSST